MPDTSPTRWHLAHVTWFFETFVLSKGLQDYTPFRADFSYLFNSYYNSIGQPFARPNRGLLSRPTMEEIFEYRRAVDQRMQEFLRESDLDRVAPLLPVVEIGLHHEQQHQELLLTDIKHVFSCNPLYPTYRERSTQASPEISPLSWSSNEGGIGWIGHEGSDFAFDNESPRHKVWLDPFLLANRLSTNEEYLRFIEDDGYARPELWLSAGWNQVCEQGWTSPLYWIKQDDGWSNFTLSGLRSMAPSEPVCHISFFEADAFARWSKARLPTEREWESAAQNLKIQGRFVEESAFHPLPFPKKPTIDLRRCSGMSGSGLRATIRLIPAISRWKARWVNTTVSSCAINTCFAVGPVSPRNRISGEPIVTSFPPSRAGSSPESVWLGSRFRDILFRKESTYE